MSEAVSLAELAFGENEFPVGAVIVHKNKIIARAKNTVETTSNPLMHAEIIAISQALKELSSKYLNECDIYVTLEPCLMCFKAISLVKIRRIYYGLPNSSGYSIENINYKLLDFNHVPEIYGGISEDSISKLFQQHLRRMRG